MKELTVEEKAKRYDKAIEIAKEINNEQRAQPFYIMTRVFPELKESEDERIRKEIIVLIKDWWDRVNKDNISTKEQMIVWLEKQGEQKVSYTTIQNTWKPSDEQMDALHDTIIYVKDSMFPSKNVLKKLYGQLKKLKEE